MKESREIFDIDKYNGFEPCSEKKGLKVNSIDPDQCVQSTQADID